MSMFTDKMVCVSGKFTDATRKDVESRLEAAGATVKTSVSKKVDILIAGDDAGSKLQRAQEYEIEIMYEDALLTALEAAEAETASDASPSASPPPSKSAVGGKKAAKRSKTDMEDTDELDIRSMGVRELRVELKKRDLNASGLKKEMVSRLRRALAADSDSEQSEEEKEPEIKSADGRILTKVTIKQMRVAELRDELEDRGLSTGGKKKTLVRRLTVAVNREIRRLKSEEAEGSEEASEPPRKKSKRASAS